jgi:hypothetical protein
MAWWAHSSQRGRHPGSSERAAGGAPKVVPGGGCCRLPCVRPSTALRQRPEPNCSLTACVGWDARAAGRLLRHCWRQQGGACCCSRACHCRQPGCSRPATLAPHPLHQRRRLQSRPLLPHATPSASASATTSHHTTKNSTTPPHHTTTPPPTCTMRTSRGSTRYRSSRSRYSTQSMGVPSSCAAIFCRACAQGARAGGPGRRRLRAGRAAGRAAGAAARQLLPARCSCCCFHQPNQHQHQHQRGQPRTV